MTSTFFQALECSSCPKPAPFPRTLFIHLFSALVLLLLRLFTWAAPVLSNQLHNSNAILLNFQLRQLKCALFPFSSVPAQITLTRTPWSVKHTLSDANVDEITLFQALEGSKCPKPDPLPPILFINSFSAPISLFFSDCYTRIEPVLQHQLNYFIGIKDIRKNCVPVCRR